MSEPKLRIAGIETPDAEVELSAEDLLGLAAPCNNNERAQEPVAKKTSAAPSVATRRSAPVSHVVGSGILTLGVIAAAYFLVASNGDASRSMVHERAPESQLPASVPASEGKPVRFANPFDPKEIFEFPAGTSEAEARDAVAEMLMERAMERQRKFDARVSSNR